MYRLAEFLTDALKFVLANGLVIEQAPSQTDSAALVFSPMNSVIRKHFWDERSPAIQGMWSTEANWDPCLQILNSELPVYKVAFSPDGKTLLSSLGHGIRLWDGVTGRERQSLNGHSGVVWFAAFSPNGKLLASGSTDGTIRLWDLARGKETRIPECHTNFVYSLAFSPHGEI